MCTMFHVFLQSLFRDLLQVTQQEVEYEMTVEDEAFIESTVDEILDLPNPFATARHDNTVLHFMRYDSYLYPWVPSSQQESHRILLAHNGMLTHHSLDGFSMQ